MNRRRSRSLYARRVEFAKRCVALAALALTLGLGLGVAGCASAPKTPPPQGIDEMSPPEILYRAILSTYEERDIPVALASDEIMLVTSEYEKLSPDLRKRMAARVVRAPRGAMGLKVTAEWQRRTVIDGEESWRPIDTEELRQRGKASELELARAIEKRFESWKEQWRASQSAE